MTNNPEKKFKAGGCSATVFINEFDTPSGKRAARNAVLERTFKDQDGTFQRSNSYSLNDIPKAIFVLQKAYEHIVREGPITEPSLVRGGTKDISQEPSS